MNGESRYYTYKTYLMNTYGKSAYRIGVDGGFSCPNRNSDGLGGCSYCDETGAVAVYHRHKEASEARQPYKGKLPGYEPPGNFRNKTLPERKEQIKNQIMQAKKFLTSRYGAKLFMLYFQAFSGTYDQPAVLRDLYDFALNIMDFKELIVSTRPDCLDVEKISLLAEYHDRVEDVWVELGLQSGINTTLERINRGHTVEQFVAAFHLLRKSGIKISIHLILGLPGEKYEEISKTAELITKLHPEAVKIHNLHIPNHTQMLSEYSRGELLVPSTARHLSYTTWFLERIPEDIIIQRLTCDTPRHRLAAPRLFKKKGEFISQLGKMMVNNNLHQGKCLQEGFQDDVVKEVVV